MRSLRFPLTLLHDSRMVMSTGSAALHGLSGDIRLGNSYCDDLHHSPGAFDFVMANAPFTSTVSTRTSSPVIHVSRHVHEVDGDLVVI